MYRFYLKQFRHAEYLTKCKGTVSDSAHTVVGLQQ